MDELQVEPDSTSDEVTSSNAKTLENAENEIQACAEKVEIMVEEKESETEPRSSARKKRSNRRKEDQFISQTLKSVSHVKDPEEKIKAIIRVAYQMSEGMTEVKNELKAAQKRCTQAVNESDQLRMESTKSTLARQRIEELCRQLQRHNKAMKDEMSKFQREDEERRKEVTQGFQNKITEINSLIQDHNDKNGVLKKQNLEIRERLDEMIERYVRREQEVNDMMRSAELQTSLAEAKIAKAEKDFTISRELFLKEKDTWTKLEEHYKAQIALHEFNEKQLKTEVETYSSKYKEFHDAFETFQKNMTKTTKKISTLEKEVTRWKDKYEAAIVLVDNSRKDKEKLLTQLEASKFACERLKGLCRAVTDERQKLRTMAKPTASLNDEVILDEWDSYIETTLQRMKDCKRVMSVAACPNCSPASAVAQAPPSAENNASCAKASPASEG